MEGILLIDKPEDWTSFDVIAKLRGAIRQKRIGHAGTLDPMATGVLPVLIGKATVLSDRLPNQQKRYTAKLQLGITTDTQDVTGNTLSTEDYSGVTAEDIERALPDYTGEILQVPPMYSAISIGGQRLYALARQGIEVERSARPITIYHVELLGFDAATGIATLDVLCSKGTYIRTLAHDIGNTLGCGAALCYLRRTMSSGFEIDRCIPLQDALTLAAEGRLAEHLLPSSSAFAELSRLEIGEWQRDMLRNGVRLSLEKLGNPADGAYQVWCGEDFLGLGTAEEGQLKLKQL